MKTPPKSWLQRLWKPGRQGTGYRKITFYQTRLTDLHLIHYPVGDGIPWHLDELDGDRKHYRLNIVLKKAKAGGEPLFLYRTKPPIFNLWNRFILFRPDITPHAVGKVNEGNRYVLSIGFVM